MRLESAGLFRDELSFEYILKADNNWEEFKAIYGEELRAVVVKEVEKMLLCRDPKAGFATYHYCPNVPIFKNVSDEVKGKNGTFSIEID